MLSVRDLETFYGVSQVLFGLGLDVGQGEVVSLLGRNGMGKTTTINSIMGIVRPRTGLIRFEGQEVTRLPSFRIAKLGLGLVPEGRQVFPNLTVLENLVATSRGPPSASSTCFRSLRRGAHRWAISCRAASSRCWRSDAP